MKKATDVTNGTPVAGDDLAPWLRVQYAYPEPATPGLPVIRANFVASIDGAATVDDRSGGLGSDGDRLLFQVLREVSDAVLVGAHTALAEGYRVPQPTDDGHQPALVLASRELSIPDDYAPAFAPGTLIATCTSAPAGERARLSALGATLVDCGADTVEPRTLREQLGARGFRRVICEGGPRLLAALLAEDVLDELAVTLAPLLVAGDAPRIAHGAAPAGPAPARLRHLIGDDEGYLYFLWSVSD